MGETERAYRVTVEGFVDDDGIYWSDRAASVRGMAWRHFADAFGRRYLPFRDFVRVLRVRRAPEFDGAYAGRQGLLPQYAAPTGAAPERREG